MSNSTKNDLEDPVLDEGEESDEYDDVEEVRQSYLASAPIR